MDSKPQPAPLIQIIMAGHVDHGKSSVLGRLYVDTGNIPPSLVDRVKGICENQGKVFEHAFLFDAFLEEQEQGITIDMARTFFRSGSRRCAILDAPGHLEFLKNLVTGASRADAAILVIDGAEGIMDQSRRHAYLLAMLGITQVVVVANKMDLLAYSQEAFERLRAECIAFLTGLGIPPMEVIPVSAREGANVANRDPRTAWYEGPTLLEALDGFLKPRSVATGPLRFCVQDIYKFDERRILAGRVESGVLRKGQTVKFLPSGKTGVVRSIEGFPSSPGLDAATTGTCTGMTLQEQAFLERGEIACLEGEAPGMSDRLRANVFWMGMTPLLKGRPYRLRLGTQDVGVEIETILHSLDASTLKVRHEPPCLERHEAGELILRTTRPIALDLPETCIATGRFILEDGYDIRGGGIVREILATSVEKLKDEARNRESSWREGEVPARERWARNGHQPALVLFEGPRGSGKAVLAHALEKRLFAHGWQVYLLDSKNLQHGLSADILDGARQETIRRFGEAAALLLHVGLVVICVTNHLPTEADRLLGELAHPHPVFTVRIQDLPGEPGGGARIFRIGQDPAEASRIVFGDLKDLLTLEAEEAAIAPEEE